MSHEHCCSHAGATPSVQQNLDELDFQRGVWSAAMDGEMDRVDKYLEGGGDPNAIDSSGYTALHYAARNGHISICKILLDHRANVNVQTRSGGATPLHRAAYQAHTDVIKLLLDRGGDVTLLDADGKCALHKAAEKASLAACTLLVEKDLSLITIRDKREQLPVDYVPENNKELRSLLSST